MNIKELINISYKMAIEKGWHETERSVPELLCLMHAEISEALEEYRNGHHIDETYFVTDSSGNEKPEGIPIELADVIIRIADFCGLHNINLEEAIETKIDYNRLRPYRHGNKKC